MEELELGDSGAVPAKSRLDMWHDFWQVATPKIFEWFQWAAVLGVLNYVNNKSPSVWLTLLVLLGYAGLIFYSAAPLSSEPSRYLGSRTRWGKLSSGSSLPFYLVVAQAFSLSTL